MKKDPNPHRYHLSREQREWCEIHRVTPVLPNSPPEEVKAFEASLARLLRVGIRMPGTDNDWLAEFVAEEQSAQAQREYKGAMAKLTITQEAPELEGPNGAN